MRQLITRLLYFPLTVLIMRKGHIVDTYTTLCWSDCDWTKNTLSPSVRNEKCQLKKDYFIIYIIEQWSKWFFAIAQHIANHSTRQLTVTDAWLFFTWHSRFDQFMSWVEGGYQIMNKNGRWPAWRRNRRQRSIRLTHVTWLF